MSDELQKFPAPQNGPHSGPYERNLMRIPLVLAMAVSLSTCTAFAQQPVSPVVEAMLVQGKLSDAEQQLTTQLANNNETGGEDPNAQFALGVVQTLQGVEGLMQSLHEYGLNPAWESMLPFVRLPVPKNDDPTPLTNEAFRQMIADFSASLARAEATLAKIPEGAEVKVPIPVGMIRMDFDSNGTVDEKEALWIVFNRVFSQRRRNAGLTQEQAEQFVIGFDTADAYWLRGYCHVLQALCDIHLAYETKELHDRTAHLFFPKAKMKYHYARRAEVFTNIADAIAFIHLIKLPVVEPERLASAREHMLKMIELSRQNWEAIQAETDDDREWLPAPQQTQTAIPGMRITGGMVKSWDKTLGEFERMLNGEKLAPFWREPAKMKGRRGINLKKVFTEPQPLDLILWAQGSGLEPFLEEGEITDPQLWREIQRTFQGRFVMFAFWIN
ncbi:hypothetical protein [Adhaeretor mobilis]|uniref:Uncharacterized protein n=1 Tax=Adhaeretor mobilis TaxID=1930276 RepID=A0A517MRF1_9BACT|nr:hypothetical protein [Adhaeretor mobilis]QDS97449.1 hypothetical protein HG15A2_07100 [Adhaeretor mobilis]